MIRHLANPPTGWNGRLPAAPPGAVAVNEVDGKLAAYWDDNDPKALTEAQWAQHVAAASYDPPVEETNERALNDRLDQSLAAMGSHVTRGTFTAAQRDAALLLVLRTCMGLVRLARRRLDAVD